jgi:hypothetical protein
VPTRTVELTVTPNNDGKIVLSPKGERLRSIAAATKNIPAPKPAVFIYSLHATVTANAVLDRGYEFVRWTGSACMGTKPVCVIRNLTKSKSIGFVAKRKTKG